MNDGLIEYNPFDRIALAKLIRQTSKTSDYVIQPFTQTGRTALLQACRSDERPTIQYWASCRPRNGCMWIRTGASPAWGRTRWSG